MESILDGLLIILNTFNDCFHGSELVCHLSMLVFEAIIMESCRQFTSHELLIMDPTFDVCARIPLDIDCVDCNFWYSLLKCMFCYGDFIGVAIDFEDT